MSDVHPINISYFKGPMDEFAPGMAEQITVITFETVTPDMYLLTFRTSGKDGNEHYFALLEYDYMFSIKHARTVIGRQFAKVIEFMPPIQKQKGRTELEQKCIRFAGTNKYYLLARTVRPTGSSYWATYIQVMPGDNIDAKLADLGPEDKTAARQLIDKILRNHVPTGTPTSAENFLESWQAKSRRYHAPSNELTVNDTNIGINVFKNVTGSWEAFYNYIDDSRPSHKVVGA